LFLSLVSGYPEEIQFSDTPLPFPRKGGKENIGKLGGSKLLNSFRTFNISGFAFEPTRISEVSKSLKTKEKKRSK